MLFFHQHVLVVGLAVLRDVLYLFHKGWATLDGVWVMLLIVLVRFVVLLAAGAVLQVRGHVVGYALQHILGDALVHVLSSVLNHLWEPLSHLLQEHIRSLLALLVVGDDLCLVSLLLPHKVVDPPLVLLDFVPVLDLHLSAGLLRWRDYVLRLSVLADAYSLKIAVDVVHLEERGAHVL